MTIQTKNTPSLLLTSMAFIAASVIISGLTSETFAQTVAKRQALEKTTRIGSLEWDLHEVTIGTVKIYAQHTGFVSAGEKAGGSNIYEAGWTQKKAWTWKQPYGVTAKDTEPAVHLNFDEAQAICRFFGKRLPKDSEWTAAAFLEQRSSPTQPFIRGKRYTYANGDTPKNSHCLNGCAGLKGLAPANSLWRGTGHVEVMTTQAGVNGLYDMGGNVWEWVDDGSGNERITRGASWWYGPENQIESAVATKPRETMVAYVGFRCVKDVSK